MIKCIITKSRFTLFNSVAFIEIESDNKINFGYLMFENDISEQSRERIHSEFQCINRSDALNFAMYYLNESNKLKNDFNKLEEFIYCASELLDNFRRILAVSNARSA